MLPTGINQFHAHVSTCLYSICYPPVSFLTHPTSTHQPVHANQDLPNQTHRVRASSNDQRRVHLSATTARAPPARQADHLRQARSLSTTCTDKLPPDSTMARSASAADFFVLSCPSPCSIATRAFNHSAAASFVSSSRAFNVALRREGQ